MCYLMYLMNLTKLPWMWLILSLVGGQKFFFQLFYQFCFNYLKLFQKKNLYNHDPHSLIYEPKKKKRTKYCRDPWLCPLIVFVRTKSSLVFPSNFFYEFGVFVFTNQMCMTCVKKKENKKNVNWKSDCTRICVWKNVNQSWPIEKKMQQKSRKSSITISSSNADKTTILAHVYYTSPNSFTRKK